MDSPSANQFEPHVRFLTWAGIITTLSLVLVNQLAIPLMIPYDGALYLQIARDMMHGKQLFVDVIDLNPPLISYLSMLPVKAAESLNIHPIITLKLAVVLALALSVVLLTVLLRHRLKGQDWAVYLFFILAFVLSSNAVTDAFSQREHLFFILFMPFFAVRYLRWQTDDAVRRLPSVLAGALAGLGLCLKPYFVFPPLLLELFWLAWKRQWRPLFQNEVLACISVGLGYALHLAILPAGTKQAFFDFVVPLTVHGYGAYNGKLADVALMSEYDYLRSTVLLVVLLTLIYVRRHPLLPALLLVAAGGYLSYLIQLKGWAYHLVILGMATCMVAVTMIPILVRILMTGFLKYPEPRLESAIQRTQMVLVSLVVALPLAVSSFYGWRVPYALSLPFARSQSQVTPNLAAEFDRLRPYSPLYSIVLDNSDVGDPIFFMSADCYPEYPLIVQLLREPAARYQLFFPVADGEYLKGKKNSPVSQEQLRQWDEKVARDCVEDVKEKHPRLLLISADDCKFMPEGECMLQWLEARGVLKELTRGFKPLFKTMGFVILKPEPGFAGEGSEEAEE